MVAVIIMRLLWSLAVLLYVRPLRCADVCERTLVVNGAEGGNASLPTEAEAVDDVTWSHKHKRIASTGPQKPINVTRTYRGKLAGDQEGSLIILNLQPEDDGTYDASIKLRSGHLCMAHYQLHVYKTLSADDIRITHTLFSREPCRLTLSCRADRSDVTITWSSGGRHVQGNEVNVTSPGRDAAFTCTAENPVSDANMSITPWKYCERGNRTWIGVLVFAAVFAVIVVAYLYYNHHHRRRSSSHRSAPASAHS